ncbi:MAG: hypothetical protein JWR61_2985 [Ferruginibacter sp.]|nr:hypothetical protein [Ferruginibacter sp.]
MIKPESINWKLILVLSFVGMVFSALFHFYNHRIFTPTIWLCLSMIFAFILIEQCFTKFFLHGFLLGITILLCSVLLKYTVFDGQIISGSLYNKMTNVTQKFSENQTLSRVLLRSFILCVLGGCFQGLITFVFHKADQYLNRRIENN